MKDNINSHQSLVRPNDVLKLLKIGKSTLYAKIKDGVLPPPVKISKRLSVWEAREIDLVIQAIMSEATIEELKTLVDKIEINRKQNHQNFLM